MNVDVTYGGWSMVPRSFQVTMDAPFIEDTMEAWRAVEATRRTITLTLNERAPDSIKRGKSVELTLWLNDESFRLVGHVRYRRLRKVVIDGHLESI